MVSGFYRDSFASSCTPGGQSLPYEGSNVVNVSTRSLTMIAGGRVRGCVGLVGIVVHYTFLYIMVEIGGLSLIIGITGSPLECNGLNWLFCLVCNLFFGIVHRPLCPVVGCATPFGGGTTRDI